MTILLDACAYLGHYPFRRVERLTAAALCEGMTERGIDRAIVSSLPAVYYRDARDGNLDLFREIAPYADRLIPAAVGNPVYNCALEDLEEYVGKYHCREIRLFPRQHGYELNDERVTAYLRRAAELSVPVAFPLWLEDPRQAAPLDPHNPVKPEEILTVALAVPEVDIVLYNADVQVYASLLEPHATDRTGRFFYDFGRNDCLYSNALKNFVNSIGTERILFATSQPLQYPEPAMVRVAFMPKLLKLSETEMERITHVNAERLFAL